MTDPSASAMMSVATASTSPPFSYHACVVKKGDEKRKMGIRTLLMRYMIASFSNMATCSSSLEGWCSCAIIARLTSLSRKLTITMTRPMS